VWADVASWPEAAVRRDAIDLSAFGAKRTLAYRPPERIYEFTPHRHCVKRYCTHYRSYLSRWLVPQ
jgi:hypothetical protein